MPSIAASLALNDAFTQRLSQINVALASTLQFMERLHAQLQSQMNLRISVFDAVSSLDVVKQQLAALSTTRSIQINVNSVEVLTQLRTIRQQIGSEFPESIIEVKIRATDIAAEAAQIRHQIESLGATSAIRLMINSAEVLSELSQIQRRIRDATVDSIIRVRLDAGDIATQAAAMRRQIDAALDGIVARIRIELPASLTAMFTNLQQLVLRLIRVTRQLRTRSGDAEDLRRALERIAALERQIADLQSRVNGRMREAGKSSSSWLGNIKGLVAAYLSIASAKALFEKTIGGAMEQRKMEDMFKARTGDAEIGKAMFDKFKAEALAAGQDVTKSLQSTLSFFSTTQNTDQLSELNNLAQRLNAFDSAGNGIEGAAFALKEAMSGDIVSLAERFNMSKSDIRAFKIDDLGKAGNMEGFIKAFDQLLEKQQMGQKAFDTMMASPAKQLETLGNNVKSTFAEAGNGAMQSLLPLITMINTAFQNGSFQPFFDGLSAGLDFVVQKGMQLIDVITNVYSFFSDNWSTIEPMIIGLTAAFVAWKGVIIASNVVMGIQNMLMAISAARAAYATGATLAQAAATTTATGAQVGLNAAIMANPFTWIVIAVIAIVAALYLLAKWLISLWNTNDQFAAGLMRAWNTILNFFDQVPIFFTRVGYGIADAFGMAKVESLKILDDLANGTIDRINDLIQKLNKIPGVNMELLNHVELVGNAAAEAEAARQQRAAKVTEMQNQADGKAAEREAKVQRMLNDRATAREKEAAEKAAEQAAKDQKGKDAAEPYDFSKWNSTHKGSGGNTNIDEVGKVGKIEKPVEISKDDLKIMRDVAEMKNIQNFVTLTPTVQVKTGPVTNTANVDSIVNKITKKLNEEISSSAQGVYS